MSISTENQILIETRVANEGPSIVVAYLLWLFLWFVSAHRFYLGRPGSAILQILSFLIVIGFIWVVIDAFLMPGMVREKQDEIRRRLSTQLPSGIR
ncbi:TM2 domain-containing membrane protein YozV [Rhodoligotrophos appendicifer]|uniref:TM2 domain-containing protein n=1 Tax=Rhodoligotrophos appendicifer TaxID=987056 RepID=UPI00117F0DA3|nr:TM2 domain-containing protein [Rhodoligotrophos appendicifer]